MWPNTTHRHTYHTSLYIPHYHTHHHTITLITPPISHITMHHPTHYHTPHYHTHYTHSLPTDPVGIMGINLGKNKTSAAESNGDYIMGVRKFGHLADYLVSQYVYIMSVCISACISGCISAYIS